MSEFPHDSAGCTGFEWDAGNALKNWEQHGISQGGAEQVFFNRPVLIAPAKETRRERRYAALGQNTDGRLLTAVFTIRGTLIRVTSARDMSRRERRVYGRQEAE